MRGLPFAGWLLLPALAFAEPETAAREAFERGTALYGAGRYREAIVQFQTAQELRPHPSVLFNIARCHENLGEFAEALAHYERMLAEPRIDDRADVEMRVRAIRERPVPVFLSTVPEGAVVRVDGAADPLAERTPTVVELPPGRHSFSFETEGATATREVDLVPAQAIRLLVAIAPADPAREPPPSDLRPLPSEAPLSADARILEEIRARREGQAALFRLGLLAGAAKYADVSFAVGADLGVVWRRILANLHWLTYSEDFIGGIDLELGYSHPFPDFDFFVGLGAGYMRVRTAREGEGGVIALPFENRTVFDASFVGGVDFFLRKTFAIGAALRLVRPFDDDLRRRPGNGADAFSLQSLTGQVTIHL